MVAKVVALAFIVAAFIMASGWLYAKYVLPHVRALKEEREKTKRKQLERDETLVADAERNYRDR